jgi:hypothetical protein
LFLPDPLPRGVLSARDWPSLFAVGLLLRPRPSDFDFGPLPEGFDRFLSFCCVAILRAELPFSRQVGLRAEFPWIEKANRWAGDANI